MNEEEKKAIEYSKNCLINTYAEKKARAIDTVLKLIEKQQKEIKRRKHDNKTLKNFVSVIFNEGIEEKYVPVQKVRNKIEEMQKEYNKLDKQVDEYINDVNKDLAKYYENKEKISIMQTLSCFIDTLQELLEGRK